MFPRIVQVKSGKKIYEYLRIVESYKENGRSKHHVIANLGRVDQLQGKMDKVVEKLREFCQKPFVLPGEIKNEETLCWGPVLIARHLWEEMELDKIIERFCQSERMDFNVAEMCFVLVANRLVEPRSEHGLARWLEHTYVCDSKGKRYLPQWLPVELVTKQQRVKVAWEQLNKWYRVLDAVYDNKREIERQLYLRMRDLFNIKVDIVFYDVTSIYFERREPKEWLRKHGYNRDGKPRNVQVVLGVVMVGGFPIASHVFRGNEADKSTMIEVVRDVDERFGLKDVIFVADKGMVSSDNREFLEGLETWYYLLGHRGRKDECAKRWLAKLGCTWIECPRGSRVQEVDSEQEGMRVFIVESNERKEYEKQMREKSMKRAEVHLKKITEAVNDGTVRKQEKIAARASVALKKDKGYRYFGYRVLGDGKFEYFQDENKLRDEKLREGRYILTTNHPKLSAEDAVAKYKELSDLEDIFRTVKDVIDGRPVYHKIDKRICAHLFIAQLSLMLIRQLRYHLEKKSVVLSAQDALNAVKSMGIAELNLKGEKHLIVSTPKRDARRVIRALGIKNLQPPGSKRKQEQ